MADEVGVKIEGLSRLRKDLDALGDGGILGDAMREVEDIVVDAATVLAPRRTGRLANRTKGTSSKFRARVSNSLIYAAPIHWGWRRRGIEAQPYMSQAAEVTEPIWFGVIQDAVQQSLDRVRGA